MTVENWRLKYDKKKPQQKIQYDKPYNPKLLEAVKWDHSGKSWELFFAERRSDGSVDITVKGEHMTEMTISDDRHDFTTLQEILLPEGNQITVHFTKFARYLLIHNYWFMEVYDMQPEPIVAEKPKTVVLDTCNRCGIVHGEGGCEMVNEELHIKTEMKPRKKFLGVF